MKLSLPLLLTTVLAGGGASDVVIAPNSAFDFVPFGIHLNDGVYTIDPTFDLQAYANITITKTYWVKPAAEGGNDSANGLSEATAFASINKALTKADVDRVMVKSGTYPINIYPASNSWGNQSPARNIEVIGYGGDVISSSHTSITFVWSAVDNHYETSYATNLTGVVDFSALDSDGDGIPLTRQDSVVNVDTNPGSWFYDGAADVLYVRTLDSREPDANIRAYVGVNNGRMDDAVTYYIEGITFEGSSGVFIAGSASADAKLYFKNCKFKYTQTSGAMDALSVTGLGEVIAQNCVASRNSGDGFKFNASGAQSANAVLIDCIGRNNGMSGSTNSNGYSRHGPGKTVAVNCEFFGNYGPQTRDITDGSYLWALGCNEHDPAAGEVNYSMGDASFAWLDGCVSSGANTDIEATETAVVRYRNMTPATPATSGTGTIEPY